MSVKRLETTTEYIQAEGRKWQVLAEAWHKQPMTVQDGYMAGFLRAQELQGAMVISPDDPPVAQIASKG